MMIAKGHMCTLRI